MPAIELLDLPPILEIIDEILETGTGEPGELVLSFSLPEDHPGDKRSLVNLTRRILWADWPLGIVSVYPGKKGTQYIEILEALHKRTSAGEEEPLWEDSVTFFACKATWCDGKSHKNRLVYKFEHNDQPIAVVVVDKTNEEYLEKAGNNRVRSIKSK
jgi:hypothetical protein